MGDYKMGAKFTKFGTPVVEGHLEGTVSQNFYLGPRFYSMISRKVSCKNVKKFPAF